MIRITRMGKKLYGYRIESIEEDAENIQTFIGEGTAVYLVNGLDELDSMEDILFCAEDVEMLY